jgi:hypothetical protein
VLGHSTGEVKGEDIGFGTGDNTGVYLKYIEHILKLKK